MSVIIIGNQCRDHHNKPCIHNGTQVCQGCRIQSGNTTLPDLFEAGAARRLNAPHTMRIGATKEGNWETNISK